MGLNKRIFKNLNYNWGLNKLDIQNSYSINKISEIFGVSSSRINKWIQVGKLIPLDPHKTHTHIASTTLWLSNKGILFSIAEIVEEWEKEQKRLGENEYDSNHVEFLLNQITMYENKYQGNFEDTLGKVEKMTAEEETDARTWEYLKSKLEKTDSINRQFGD